MSVSLLIALFVFNIDSLAFAEPTLELDYLKSISAIAKVQFSVPISSRKCKEDYYADYSGEDFSIISNAHVLFINGKVQEFCSHIPPLNDVDDESMFREGDYGCMLVNKTTYPLQANVPLYTHGRSPYSDSSHKIELSASSFLGGSVSKDFGTLVCGTIKTHPLANEPFFQLDKTENAPLNISYIRRALGSNGKIEIVYSTQN